MFIVDNNRKNTVLVVDDSASNLEMLVHMLEDKYRVKVANSGKRALEVAAHEPPDLILLDIMMPDMNGYDVCRQLKKNVHTSEIPIIFVTGKDSERDEELGFELGAVDYIRKPFKKSTIISRVGTHLQLYIQEQILKDFNHILTEQVEEEVTARMKLEKDKKIQEAMITQQAKLAEVGEMTSAIAHQWKQPLNASNLILMNLEDMLEEQGVDNEEIYESIESMRRQLEYMGETIDDFRKFLVPSTKNTIFEPSKSISEILNMFKYQFLKQKIEIVIDTKDGFRIQGKENEFKQVLMNLFKNASDVFTERGVHHKNIYIEVSSEGSSGSVKICDNAGGIPEELLPEKLFEAYVTTKGEGGTGIGLQLVKRIIVEHFKGDIVASNQGAGACFKITLPAIR